jgi:hypothetical protein
MKRWSRKDPWGAYEEKGALFMFSFSWKLSASTQSITNYINNNNKQQGKRACWWPMPPLFPFHPSILPQWCGCAQFQQLDTQTLHTFPRRTQSYSIEFRSPRDPILPKDQLRLRPFFPFLSKLDMLNHRTNPPSSFSCISFSQHAHVPSLTLSHSTYHPAVGFFQCLFSNTFLLHPLIALRGACVQAVHQLCKAGC